MALGGLSAIHPFTRPAGPQVVRQVRQPGSRGAGRNPFAWTPWKPQPIPAGLYNPTLDAELGAADRGTADTTAEGLTALTRGTSDYNLSKEGFERSEQEGLGEISTARQREQDNTQQALTRLSDAYKRLGVGQEEQQNAAGVLSGGAALQAAAKRQANEARDQAPIKQSEERSLADLAVKQKGLEEGTERSLGDLALHDGPVSPQILRLVGELSDPHARAHAQGELSKLEESPGAAGLFGGRASQDVLTKLVHAQREDQQFGVNVAAQKAHEAAMLGYVPPPQPKGERRTSSGQVYRTIRHGNEWWDVTPQGNVIKKRRV